MFTADSLALVRRHTGLPAPMPADHGCYLLVECADESDPSDRVVAALEAADEVERGGGGRPTLRAGNGSGATARRTPSRSRPRGAGEARRRGAADGTGRLRRRAALSYVRLRPHGRVIVFGHLAEGNLHVNVARRARRNEHEVSDAVLRRVAELGGSISAEHGVGRAKVEWLGLTRTPAEIDAMTAIKRALDPGWLLGPGVLLPAPESSRG